MTEQQGLEEQEILKRFQRALDVSGGCYDVHHIVEKIRAGEMQLHQTPDGRGFMITAIHVYPKKKILHHFLTFGFLKDNWNELYDKVIQFGIDNGCDAMVGEGRHGWTRIVKALGWQVTGSTYKIDLAK